MTKTGLIVINIPKRVVFYKTNLIREILVTFMHDQTFLLKLTVLGNIYLLRN